MTDVKPYASIELPDGELRIWEPAPDSDDASRMYVLDVLGIDVTLRWKRNEEDGGLELYVAVLRDADSTPLGRGELTVEVDMDANSYGGIGEGPVVCPSTERYPGDIVGCGAIVTSPSDWEGFYDCGSCGMFFQLEGDRRAETSTRPTEGICSHCSAPVHFVEGIGYVSDEPGAPSLEFCGGFPDEGNRHNVTQD